MRNLALDIDVFVASLGKDARILRTVAQYDRIFISDVVWAQLEFALEVGLSDETDQKLARANVYSFESARLGTIWCDRDWHLPFTMSTASQFASLKHEFDGKPYRFSNTELMIAANALDFECDLATFNEKYSHLNWLKVIIPT